MIFMGGGGERRRDRTRRGGERDWAREKLERSIRALPQTMGQNRINM